MTLGQEIDIISIHMRDTVALGAVVACACLLLYTLLLRRTSSATRHGTRNPQTKEEWTQQLLDACFACDFELVEKALQNGADATAMTAHFEDAPVLIVSQACRYSSLDQTQEPFKLLDLLLAHGADINAQNYRGHTALSQAASRGDESMVEYLLEHGAERAVKNRLGASPRRVARAQGHTKVARMLEY